jgi:hypothetical protein
MLIIAQPKSASTSLLYTLTEMLKIRASKGTKRKSFHITHEGFDRLQYYHTLIFERSPLDIKIMIDHRDMIYREHLLPCNRNFRILNKYKNFIVLLRKPEDSYNNYVRLGGKEDKELLQELKDFNNLYIKYLKNRKDILCINYKDLILNYKKTMNKIVKYWNIKSKVIPLKKEKYTGVGVKRLCKKQ